MAFVHGEAGIGKTALLATFAQELQENSSTLISINNTGEETGSANEIVRLVQTVHESYGDELWSALPEAVRTELPQFLNGGETDPRKDLDSAHVAEVLGCAAAIRPLAVIIDGANHMTKQSERVLETLAMNHAGAPFFLLASYRSHEVQASDSFSGFLGELNRYVGTQSIALGGLSNEELRELLEGVVGYELRRPIVDDVYDATLGNPLYAVQVGYAVREAVELNDEASIRFLPGLSRRIAQTIARRFNALSKDTQRIIQRIAILGRDVSASSLHIAMAETTTDSLDSFFDETIRAGFIIEKTSPDRELHAQISHPIVRDAIAGMMSPIQRSRTALEMAELMERNHGGDADIATLARLYCQSITPDGLQKCATQSLKAGHLAIQRQQWADAVEHFERYVANQRGAASTNEVGNALLELGRALLELDRRSVGKERLAEAFEHFAATGNVEGIVALVTYPNYHVGYAENLLSLLERARSIVPQAHPGWLWVSVRYAISLHDDAGDYRRAREVAQEVLADGRIENEPAVACRASSVAAVAAIKLRDFDGALELTGTCERYSNLDSTLTVWREYTKEYMLRAQGRLKEAEETLNRALVHAYRLRDRRYRWPALVRATDYAFRRGDFGNAVAHAEEGIALNGYSDVHLRDRGTIALLTGDDETLHESIRRLRRRTGEEGPWPETARVSLMGLLTLASHLTADSHWGREADDMLNRGQELISHPYFASRLAAASGYRAFTTGNAMRGAESYRRLMGLEDYHLMSAEYWYHRLAVSAAAAGYAERATQLFEDAVTWADSLSNEPARALILYDYAAHAAAQEGGVSSKAGELRSKAQTIARKLGMRRITRVGDKRGEWTELLPSITGRELQVLKVVARGSTNQQIADTLGISTNTVAFHVRSIMEKIGLANRAQAVAFSWKNGIITAEDLEQDFPTGAGT